MKFPDITAEIPCLFVGLPFFRASGTCNLENAPPVQKGRFLRKFPAFSLLAGISFGERLARDCVLRQQLSNLTFTSR